MTPTCTPENMFSTPFHIKKKSSSVEQYVYYSTN